MAWVCDRPFTTVNFGATQLSCAQLMNQFVPCDLLVAGSVVMLLLVHGNTDDAARNRSYCQIISDTARHSLPEITRIAQ